MSRYDIVLYGASGFTGAYVLKLLVEEQQNISFAIAGRSEARLRKLLDSTGQDLGKSLHEIFLLLQRNIHDIRVFFSRKTVVY